MAKNCDFWKCWCIMYQEFLTFVHKYLDLRTFTNPIKGSQSLTHLLQLQHQFLKQKACLLFSYYCSSKWSWDLGNLWDWPSRCSSIFWGWKQLLGRWVYAHLHLHYTCTFSRLNVEGFRNREDKQREGGSRIVNIQVMVLE